MAANRAQVTYAPRPDATPESEITALADIYAFVLRCAEEKRRAAVGAAQDARKGVNNDPDTPSIPE